MAGSHRLRHHNTLYLSSCVFGRANKYFFYFYTKHVHVYITITCLLSMWRNSNRLIGSQSFPLHNWISYTKTCRHSIKKTWTDSLPLRNTTHDNNIDMDSSIAWSVNEGRKCWLKTITSKNKKVITNMSNRNNIN